MKRTVKVMPFNFYSEKIQTTKNGFNFILKKIELIEKTCEYINNN